MKAIMSGLNQSAVVVALVLSPAEAVNPFMTTVTIGVSPGCYAGLTHRFTPSVIFHTNVRCQIVMGIIGHNPVPGWPCLMIFSNVGQP